MFVVVVVEEYEAIRVSGNGEVAGDGKVLGFDEFIPVDKLEGIAGAVPFDHSLVDDVDGTDDPNNG